LKKDITVTDCTLHEYFLMSIYSSKLKDFVVIKKAVNYYYDSLGILAVLVP